MQSLAHLEYVCSLLRSIKNMSTVPSGREGTLWSWGHFLPIQENSALGRFPPFKNNGEILTPAWPWEQLEDTILWRSIGKDNSRWEDTGIVELQADTKQGEVCLQLLFMVNFRAGIPC